MTASVPEASDVAIALGRDAFVIQDVYEAEVADQSRRCRVEPYNAALASALVRRVSRSLAMRNLPLGVLQDETGATRVGSVDPEVRRLEAPYRRVVIG
ncbi:hypothetical protein ENKNEFLB_02829 [Nocardioides aquaticus]|uniref:Uncharacterized protein n=1 Tax=Nocardioides aquaticus TaxID=160826 RepID=A0ABX8EJJ0_9ACTN|nr:hypothetical protein [Nocardioides aquaticus]QVT80434.1 hypothetical protein ENKNEFLB_02829 [Nocardioides aquaticus]